MTEAMEDTSGGKRSPAASSAVEGGVEKLSIKFARIYAIKSTIYKTFFIPFLTSSYENRELRNKNIFQQKRACSHY